MGGSTLPLAPDAYSGRKLGKYEVLCRLSMGGMAEIFLASQRGLAGFRKLVVLKQILPDIAGEEEFVQMFLDEARVTAAFNHPHIAQVFDLDVAEDVLFLAMEFVPGATLVEVARACRAANEPIPVGFSLEAVRDTALALHYAHTFTDPLGRPSSVIHRDVAEKNIMVTYEGVTKLLDFGIAKNLARRGRTQVGMVKGTSGYMSPEQILGEPLDARSDLFSLGVVLHELLTGLRLFHAKTPEAGAGAVLHGQVPPPSRSNKSIPPELDAIVLKTLSRKREDRYSTTLEFARALERAVGPLIWHPEQSGELIRRFFSDRREQTRQLLVAGQALSGETTGEVNLAKLFPSGTLPSAPPLPPEPGTAPSLPQITPSLPTPRPSSVALPSVRPPPPPPQEQTQARPPTPPRGAATRRLSNAGMPAMTSPEAPGVRRQVFDPLPQKRSAAATAPDLLPLPAPSQESTARTHPGDDPPPPPSSAWTDEDSMRVALEVPRASEHEEQDDSQAEIRTRLEAPPRSEARARPGPMRMDLHTMGTIPWTEGPPGLRNPPAEDEDTASGGNSREVKTAVTRVPTPPSNPGPRPPRRRVVAPPPEELPSEEELSQAEIPSDMTTRPLRSSVHAEEEDEEPHEDTNETLIPEGEEEGEEEGETETEGEEAATLLTSPNLSVPRRQPKPQRGGLLVLLAVGVLLVGGLGLVVALGLDGGRLMALVSPPAPTAEELGRPQPLPGARSRPTPAPTPAPALSKPTTPEGSLAPPPPEAAAPSTSPSGTVAEAAAAPEEGSESDPSVAPLEVITDELEPEPAQPEPAQPKKTRPATKRTRVRDPAKPTSGEGSEASSTTDSPPAAPTPSGPGLLTLVTSPYAKVYLKGRYLGDTPLFKISFPAGKHSLKLVGEDGQARRLQVEIKPGENKLKYNLTDLDVE